MTYRSYIHLIPDNLPPMWDIKAIGTSPNPSTNRVSTAYPRGLINPSDQACRLDILIQQLTKTAMISSLYEMMPNKFQPVADLYGIALSVFQQMYLGGSQQQSLDSIVQTMTPIFWNGQATLCYDTDTLMKGADPCIMGAATHHGAYFTNCDYNLTPL